MSASRSRPIVRCRNSAASSIEEAQVVDAELGQLLQRAPARERQARLLPRRNHEAQAPRQPLDEVRQRGVDLGIVDDVIVVEHQHDVLLGFAELVQEQRHQVLGHGHAQAAEKRDRRARHARLELLQRAHDVVQEVHRVAIGFVERDPGDANGLVEARRSNASGAWSCRSQRARRRSVNGLASAAFNRATRCGRATTCSRTGGIEIRALSRGGYAGAAIGGGSDLVIAGVGPDLAAKHVIRPARVNDDDRQQEQRADQQEGLRLGRCRAFHRLMECGTMLGHRLMPRPRKHIRNRPDGGEERRRVARPVERDPQPQRTRPAVASGNGARYAILGQVNQRAAMRGSDSGVQMLTRAMNATTPTSEKRAHAFAQYCTASLGLHHEPGRAEQQVAEHEADADRERERPQPVVDACPRTGCP